MLTNHLDFNHKQLLDEIKGIILAPLQLLFSNDNIDSEERMLSLPLFEMIISFFIFSDDEVVVKFYDDTLKNLFITTAK